MNIKITTFSLIVAATCGLAFSQTVKAEEEENRVKPGNMRFDFGNNTYALDHVQPRHHYMSTFTPSSVHNGAAPKNLLGLDPSFLAKPAPLPVAAPAPQQNVSAKIANNSPFASLFGHPVQAPLSAPPAGAFGMPASQAKPLIASAPHVSSNSSLNGKLLTHPKHHPAVGAAARPFASTPIASYPGGQFYAPGQVNAGYINGGGSTSTAISGVVLGHKRH